MATHRASIVILFAALTLGLVACGGVVGQGDLDPTRVPDEEDGSQRANFPWIGEKMDYTVTLGDVKILQAGIVAGALETAEDGTRYIPISGVAESIPGTAFATFYPITDAAQAFIDPYSWRPFHSITDLHERDKKRVYYVDYDYPGKIARAEKHTDKGVLKRKMHIPDNTHSSLSWVYAMRSIPLEPGRKMTWYEYDGWKLNRFTVAVQEAEEVWTPLGIFDTYRCDIYREVVHSHIAQGALAGAVVEPEYTVKEPITFVGNVWLSDDDRRVPVRMGIDTSLGDVEVLLHAYSPPASDG